MLATVYPQRKTVGIDVPFKKTERKKRSNSRVVGVVATAVAEKSCSASPGGKPEDPGQDFDDKEDDRAGEALHETDSEQSERDHNNQSPERHEKVVAELRWAAREV